METPTWSSIVKIFFWWLKKIKLEQQEGGKTWLPRQLTTGPLQGNKDCMSVAFHPHCSWALLHSLHGVLNLTKYQSNSGGRENPKMVWSLYIKQQKDTNGNKDYIAETDKMKEIFV